MLSSPYAGSDVAAAEAKAYARAPRLRHALLAAGLALALWLLVFLSLPLSLPELSLVFLPADLAWCASFAALLVGLSALPDCPLVAGPLVAAMRRLPLAVLLLAGAVLVVTLLCTYGVYHGFALSRDEAMARFDATIIGHGRLVAPVPPPWRPFVPALAPTFLQPIGGGAGWVSTYLPGHAALRALVGLVGAADWTSPVLASIAILAVVGIARRLWPERPDAALVAGLLVATAPQVLVTAMTPYAMTAHLALNLVWLWLFLHGTRLGHAGAIGLGVLATGLHQPIFHPLFVLPFVLKLWLERRFRLAGLYTLAYAVIGLAWLSYWRLMLHAYGLAQPSGTQSLLASLADLLHHSQGTALGLMALNLTRFIAWENPLVVPLAGAALLACRRMDRTVAAAAIGILLTLVAVFLLMPYQGHGWGYRYLHGLIGSVCLIAAQGWVVLVRPGMIDRPLSVLGAACLFALAVACPGRAYEVARFVAPSAGAVAEIAEAPADFVLVDPGGTPFMRDLVRNDPFLRNHPLVFDLDGLDDAALGALCATGRVAIFDRASAGALRLPFVGTADPARRAQDAAKRRELARLGCGVPIDTKPGAKP